MKCASQIIVGFSILYKLLFYLLFMYLTILLLKMYINKINYYAY